MKWFSTDDDRRRTILEQTSAQTGVPEHAVEKDFWVCIILKLLFESKHGVHLLFKGGTSLSGDDQTLRKKSLDFQFSGSVNLS